MRCLNVAQPQLEREQHSTGSKAPVPARHGNSYRVKPLRSRKPCPIEMWSSRTAALAVQQQAIGPGHSKTHRRSRTFGSDSVADLYFPSSVGEGIERVAKESWLVVRPQEHLSAVVVTLAATKGACSPSSCKLTLHSRCTSLKVDERHAHTLASSI